MASITIISNPRSFWEAARWQRVCAACDRVGGRPDFRGRTWHAHHVMARKLLRRLRHPEWDTRNALRLCTDCHGHEQGGGILVPVAKLKDDNICCIWEVLGIAVVQIEHVYGSFDLDPRWQRHRMGECALCQLT